MADVSLTVGDISDLVGVSVRTLHHYDALGLVKPRARTASGYRVYGRSELERLQEVLFFKELGVPLDDILRLIESDGYDRVQTLRSQKDRLHEARTRIDRLIGAVEAAIVAERKGLKLSAEELLDVFGDFDPSEHTEEVEMRWGATEQFAESQRRTSRYSADDWRAIQSEAAEINQAIAAAIDAGHQPQSEVGRELASRHREHISKWFYDCSPEMHASLGEMYVSDPRFRASLDATREGVAEFLAGATKPGPVD